MKLMIAVSAVHVAAFEAVPWAPPANHYPELAPARVQRVRRHHELAPVHGSSMAQGQWIAEAR